jgi:hypothetical protein
MPVGGVEEDANSGSFDSASAAADASLRMTRFS